MKYHSNTTGIYHKTIKYPEIETEKSFHAQSNPKQCEQPWRCHKYLRSNCRVAVTKEHNTGVKHDRPTERNKGPSYSHVMLESLSPREMSASSTHGYNWRLLLGKIVQTQKMRILCFLSYIKFWVKGRTWNEKKDYLRYLSLRDREIGQWKENYIHMYMNTYIYIHTMP